MQHGSRRAALVLTALLAGAALAVAQDPGPEKQAPDEPTTIWEYLVAKYDADGDGVITRAEYTRDDEHWARLDVNRDGRLERAEIEKRPRGQGERERVQPPEEGERAPNFRLEKVVLPAAEEQEGDGATEGDGEREDEKQKRGADERKQKKVEPEYVELSSFRGAKPVALIFGSYT